MDDGVVVRRVMDADNNCLFNAVGYVMEHTRGKAKQLRQVIASVIMKDKEKYNRIFLGKENSEYCNWILNPNSWGGAIELSIFSEFYKKEIFAFDIQTERCDRYGQDKNYDESVLIVYDGIHYDALAFSPFETAPESVDQTIFSKNDFFFTGKIIDLTKKLIKTAHLALKFTDTQNFTLRCSICQMGIKGQKDVIEHAKATGHSNFVEYQ